MVNGPMDSRDINDDTPVDDPVESLLKEAAQRGFASNVEETLRAVPCPTPSDLREYHLRRLPDGDSRNVAEHLLFCSSCWKSYVQLRRRGRWYYRFGAFAAAALSLAVLLFIHQGKGRPGSSVPGPERSAASGIEQVSLLSSPGRHSDFLVRSGEGTATENGVLEKPRQANPAHGKGLPQESDRSCKAGDCVVLQLVLEKSGHLYVAHLDGDFTPDLWFPLDETATRTGAGWGHEGNCFAAGEQISIPTASEVAEISISGGPWRCFLLWVTEQPISGENLRKLEGDLAGIASKAKEEGESLQETAELLAAEIERRYTTPHRLVYHVAQAPPCQRELEGEDKTRVEELEKRISELEEKRHHAEAAVLAKEVAAIRARIQGEDHWEVIDAVWRARTLARLAGMSEELQGEYAELKKLAAHAEALYLKSQYPEAYPLWEKALVLSRKLLGEEHPKLATIYNSLARNLREQGKYAEAQALFEKALGLKRKLLGEEHPATATGYNNLGMNLDAREKHAKAQALYEKALALNRKLLGEEHLETAAIYNNLGKNLSDQGKFDVAQQLLKKALAVSYKCSGEEEPLSSTVIYNNLASSFFLQAKYAEAQPLFKKALAIFRKRLGEEHLDTAKAYGNLSAILTVQGKYAEAQPLLEKALAICRKLLGEEHLDTATSYNNLARNLNDQGKYAEAQSLLEKALLIKHKVLDEDRCSMATIYHNLAMNLKAQGKYAVAQPLFEKALRFFRKHLGEKHLYTASTYNSLGIDLTAQGKYAEAERFLKKALALKQKLFGEKHSETATSYNNLAMNLNAQRKYAEAQPLLEKALALCRKLLGDEHPDTATSYHNLAGNFYHEGKYAEAQARFKKALVLRRKLLGDEHPATANSCICLAASFHAQGKYTEALAHWEKAARIFEKTRLWIDPRGLERAVIEGERSPLPSLAAVLARLGRAREAWARWEASLGRGLLDEMASRGDRRISEADRQREAELLSRLSSLETVVERLSAKKLGEKERQRLAQIRRTRLEVQAKLSRFEEHLEATYGVATGKVSSLEEIQSAVPPDTALVGWLDLRRTPNAADSCGDHWCVVVRSKGEPRWVHLSGSGPEASWTEEDDTLARRVAELLVKEGSDADMLRKLLVRLSAQRLDPVQQFLEAGDGLPLARRLVVVPSPSMRGMPVSLLAERFTVSYAPSGTVYAHLRQNRDVKKERGVKLLAVAAPLYSNVGAKLGRGEPVPPEGGVFLRWVQKGSNAERSGLRSGDVLLSYGGKGLANVENLSEAVEKAAGSGESVRVTVWRAGETLAFAVEPGRLGVKPAKEAPAVAVRSQRELRELLRGAPHAPRRKEKLPGTRREVEVIAKRFEATGATADCLLGPEAREEQLRELAEHGELKKYAYLHFAVHARTSEERGFGGSLMLSDVGLPDPLDYSLDWLAARGAGIDGEVTAGEILRTWELDAELVVLSACETGIGRYVRGEGYLGFSQALLLAGARTMVLSLWKVKDDATALLMIRFYENLLGARQGGGDPLGKGESLREAQAWLRGLGREEAAAVRQRLGLVKPPDEQEPLQPYAHPYYWAGFIVIGDPE